MDAETTESMTVRNLTAWFQEKLDQSEMHWEDEPLSYDGNTQYDILFYRLQKEAAQFWQERYGFVPTVNGGEKPLIDGDEGVPSSESV